MNKIVCFFIVFLFSISMCAESFQLSKVKTIVKNSNLKLKNGTISNLTLAPFSKNLVSFEIETTEYIVKKNRKVRRLFLLNLKNKKLMEIDFKNYNPKTKLIMTKNIGLRWHPSKKAFLFHNLKYMYYCEVLNENLINNYSINGYRLNLSENKDVKSFRYKEPVFSYNGNSIYFARREILKGKKKYNKSFNICMISDMASRIRNKDFNDIDFEVVMNKKYSQSLPLVFKIDNIEVLAYLSMQNKKTKSNSDGFYNKYSIDLFDIEREKNYKIANCEGYKIYNYYTSNDHKLFYYLQPLPIIETPQELIDIKSNILNLRAVKLTVRDSKLTISNLKNNNGNIILEDVSNRGMSFYKNSHFLISAYRNGKSVLLFTNIDLWNANHEDYTTEIESKGIIYYPIVNKNNLCFVLSKYIKNKDKFLDLVSTAGFKAVIAKKELPKIIVKKDLPITDNTSNDDDDDEYSEEDDFADEEYVLSSAKNDKKENEVIKLQALLNNNTASLAKVNNKISKMMQEVIDEKDKLSSLNKQIVDINQQKSSLILEIAQLHDKKSISSEKLKILASKRDELDKLNSLLDNIVLKIESNKKSVRDEDEKLKNFEAKLVKIGERKKQIISNLSDLKVANAKTQKKDSQIAELNNILLEQQSEIKIIDKKISVNQNLIISLKQDIKDSSKNIKDYQSEKENLVKGISEFKMKKNSNLAKRKEEFLDGIDNILKDKELTAGEIFKLLGVDTDNVKEVTLVSELLGEKAEYFKNNSNEYYYRLKGSKIKEDNIVVDAKKSDILPSKDEIISESDDSDEYTEEDDSSTEEYFEDEDEDEDNGEDDKVIETPSIIIKRRR